MPVKIASLTGCFLRIEVVIFPEKDDKKYVFCVLRVKFMLIERLRGVIFYLAKHLCN
jgi:hypothetical protein